MYETLRSFSTTVDEFWTKYHKWNYHPAGLLLFYIVRRTGTTEYTADAMTVDHTSSEFHHHERH